MSYEDTMKEDKETEDEDKQKKSINDINSVIKERSPKA